MIAVLHPQRLAPKGGKDLECLLPENYGKILDKWDIIKAVVKEGK